MKIIDEKISTVLAAAADWAAQAAEHLSQHDAQLAAMTDNAVGQGWPLVVTVVLDRMQVSLCTIAPDGRMAPLVTAAIEVPDARRAN